MKLENFNEAIKLQSELQRLQQLIDSICQTGKDDAYHVRIVIYSNGGDKQLDISDIENVEEIKNVLTYKILPDIILKKDKVAVKFKNLLEER